MFYKLNILPQAEKEINKLPNNIADAIFEEIEKLLDNPSPFGSIKMKNYSNARLKVRVYHRIKVKKVYRVIYHIEENVCTITIIRVGHRNKVYN